jgi:hypothetical protein
MPSAEIQNVLPGRRTYSWRIPITTLNFFLFSSTLVLLALGWPISVISGQKLHYFYFLFTTALLLLINMPKRSVPLVIPCYVSFAVVFCLHALDNGLTALYVFSAATYLAIPWVYSKNLLSIDKFDKVLELLSYITLLNLVGVFLQMMHIGADTELLKPDHALTGKVYHLRYTGFSGGALALGVISCITAFHSFHHVLLGKKRKLAFYAVVFVASITCLVLSFSRRFFVSGFFGLAVIGMIWFRNKRLTKTLFIIISIIMMVMLVCFVVIITASPSIADRILSIVNFSSDEANVGRIDRWNYAFELFKNNKFIGLGPGETGTVGRENVTNKTVFSAESYYLKVLLETGVFVALCYAIFAIGIIWKGLSRINTPQMAVPFAIILFYLIESVASTSLESPFSAILLFSSASLVHFARSSVLVSSTLDSHQLQAE